MVRIFLFFLLLPLFTLGQVDTGRVRLDTIIKRGSISTTGIINNPGVGNKQVILQSSIDDYLRYKNTDYTLGADYRLAYSGSKKTGVKGQRWGQN